MSKLYIEFTNDTLVATNEGVQKLTDLLGRSVQPCLWGIKWNADSGITFHRSHKEARRFAETRIASVPDGPARLVDVSNWIYEQVVENDFCLTSLHDFDQAINYEGSNETTRSERIYLAS